MIAILTGCVSIVNLRNNLFGFKRNKAAAGDPAAAFLDWV
jgi:hypothetical protein